jgi:hypothetical protein
MNREEIPESERDERERERERERVRNLRVLDRKE